MKLKTILSLLILSSTFHVSISQVTIDFKDRPKLEQTFNFRKISSNKDFIYNLGIKDKGEESIYFIEKYSVTSLNFEYQKDLKICEEDKAALVHPLFVPPVCFEYNNQLVVFYCSYNKTDKKVNINVKTVNEKGDVNSKFQSLVSSKDISVQLGGWYWNTIGYNKPVIGYKLSEDKKTVLIEIDSPKFSKIYAYAISDLLLGKTDHKEIDLLPLVEKEKIIINRFFMINNDLCFSYTKKISEKNTDFGFATLDNKTNNFQLKNLGLNVTTPFSIDYKVDQAKNKIFIAGFLRYSINSAEPVNVENSKVKLFNVQFNLASLSFENKNEFDFLPSIAKIISVPKLNYGFIDKKHSPDQYLENVDLLESPNYYYNISHLLFGREPGSAIITPSHPGGDPMSGGGVTTVSRDILVTKLDRAGKLIDQYLLPRATVYNTFAGSRSGSLVAFANKQRNFNYGIMNDDLHFFYLDNKKNPLTPLDTYDPSDIKKCEFGKSALVHFSIKSNKIEKEILIEKDNKCFFYSNQNMMVNNAVLFDLEIGKKNSQVGRIIIDK
ncbi:MAG: hypothetical protein H7263_16525 [Candidatus Sericytochromatia bacterium]|nr:hypothetical protein [Candidatus Sericytochromatia bacterium]